MLLRDKKMKEDKLDALLQQLWLEYQTENKDWNKLLVELINDFRKAFIDSDKNHSKKG
jgi:hypothetical protein